MRRVLNDPRRWSAVLVAGGALALCGTAAAGVFDPRPGDKVIGKAGGLAAARARKAHVLGGGLKLGGPANQARAAARSGR
jgi:hypothetical protein